MDLDTKESRSLDCATIWKLNDDILLIRFKDGFDLNLQDAVEVRDASIELVNGGKFLTLIDGRNISGSLGNKASKYFAQNEKLAAHRMAQAIVVNTLALKMVVRFYIKLNAPRREAKIFNHVEDALEWLETKKHLLKND